jgi:hypothetical protein
MTAPDRTLRLLATGLVQPRLEEGWDAGLSAADKRRSPRIWRMASVAAQRTLAASVVVPRSLVAATALGALDETRAFLDRLYSEGLGSPRNFIASVHNSMAGKLAQELTIRGPNLTICDGQNSFAAALVAADLLSDDDLPVLVIAVDENVELLSRLVPNFSEECRAFLHTEWTDGAAGFLLSREAADDAPRLRAAGPSPTDREGAEQTCAALLPPPEDRSPTFVPLAQCSTSFLGPPMTVHELACGQSSGCWVVPSFAPSSQAAAVVELCV